MTELTIKAYAKINLTLEIIRRLPSGYHEIKSVMQQTELCDDLTIMDAHAGITIQSTDRMVPGTARNSIWKATTLLKERCGVDRGVKFKLVKCIPVGGGMGGGSADAAAALIGLNTFWQLGLSQAELLEIGREIGMDVAFCILGGTALATGRGEVVQPLPAPPTLHLVIVNPGVFVSTRNAYEGLKLEQLTFTDKSAQMIAAIERGDVAGIIANLHNDFEYTVLNEYPVIGTAKRSLLEAGAEAALLSGSGASVFGIAATQAQAQAIAEALKPHYPFVVATHTLRIED
ncbi:MAG TPA: 4-(cytidine 5'-diphospho)-2-C-methyl-D-erythritol kinase [Anaerolineae bacterium]|nr:4-(cytidine 5'-diphospho)-2-C-methyl-D-erythritol kinase [Anaerolineae bacterium]HQK12384.1 4-(cytidine 5'-diphospho)-2-C-methyl-D-erythritol kinase [Anaerolineae bacterium]